VLGEIYCFEIESRRGEFTMNNIRWYRFVKSESILLLSFHVVCFGDCFKDTLSVMDLMISLASDAAASASELLPSLWGFSKDATLPQSSQQKDTDFFAKRRRSEIVNFKMQLVWNGC